MHRGYSGLTIHKKVSHFLLKRGISEITRNLSKTHSRAAGISLDTNPERRTEADKLLKEDNPKDLWDVGPEWGSSQAGALEELRLMLSRPAVGRSGSAVALARTAQLWGHPNSFQHEPGDPRLSCALRSPRALQQGGCGSDLKARARAARSRNTLPNWDAIISKQVKETAAAQLSQPKGHVESGQECGRCQEGLLDFWCWEYEAMTKKLLCPGP
ncbi:hypothetical protein Anapl_09832 [Anas platyrhynchos]|uniref:Uncharacterized protein n=1 Tax=Anas platyrhynchos TaxID=8839 RepID=R0L5F6_ANAPL|nr:hypothetical protein Anapl_09832 [Anas platyrhynchos]